MCLEEWIILLTLYYTHTHTVGVTVTENLTPDRHIDKITGEMMNLLKRVKKAFSYLDE